MSLAAVSQTREKTAAVPRFAPEPSVGNRLREGAGEVEEELGESTVQPHAARLLRPSAETAHRLRKKGSASRKPSRWRSQNYAVVAARAPDSLASETETASVRRFPRQQMENLRSGL